MVETIIKRNGNKAVFDKNKIIGAITAAFSDCEYDVKSKKCINIIGQVADKVEQQLTNNISVEEIQDLVEKEIADIGYFDVAKAYITYRHLRTLARTEYNDLWNAIREKLSADNVENQNANVDERSFGGRLGEVSRVVTKKYALDFLMSDMARNNHLNNEIYIHDLDSYALGSHNCYLRSTRFITDEGIKSFENFNDGDEVKVLTKDGKWSDATVHFYGRQPMYEITLSRCGISKTVVATSNHRWLLSNGAFTTHLEVGDSLFPLPSMEEIEITTKRQAEMFALGFILGDGYDHKGILEVKFCTKEKEQYIGIFAQAGYRIGISNNFKYARKKSPYTKQEFLNNHLWNILSFEDKRCLFEGYLAADGSKTTNTKYLWTSDKRLCDLIEDISAINGYHIFKKKTISNDTQYKKNRVLYEYTFTTKYDNKSTWKVISIEKGKHRNKDYEAWCIEEPTTHTFTLEGGIITGNCLSLPLDDLLANGFNTRQADVRPANCVNTAFQLVAVLFQLQSLQQFGKKDRKSVV